MPVPTRAISAAACTVLLTALASACGTPADHDLVAPAASPGSASPAASSGSGDVKIVKSWYGKAPGTPDGWHDELQILNPVQGIAVYRISVEYLDAHGRTIGVREARTPPIAGGCANEAGIVLTAATSAFPADTVKHIRRTTVAHVQRLSV